MLLKTLALVLLCAASVTSSAQDSAAERSRVTALLQGGRPQDALALLRTLPASWQTDYQTGLAQVQLNDLAAAKAAFDRALKGNPGFLPARKNLATVRWFLNERAPAEASFREILKTNPADPAAHLYVGLADFERRRFREAKGHLEQAGDLARANPEVIPVWAEACLATRDEAAFRQIASRAAGEPALLFRLAQLLVEYQRGQAAVALLASVPPAAPGAEAYAITLAQAQLLAVQPAAAVQTIEALPTRRTSQALLLLAEAYDRLGQPDKAYKAYRTAFALAGRSDTVCVRFAAFAAAHRNDEYGLQLLDQCLADHEKSAPLLLMKGLLLSARGDHAAAELQLKAAAAGSTWTLPRLALGVLHLERGQTEAAVTELAAVSRQDPDNAVAHYLHGTALSRAPEDAARTRAVVPLRRATELAPQDARFRAALGQSLIQTGQAARGVTELEQAIALDPKQPLALYQLGLAYRAAGRLAESRQMLARFQAEKAQGRAEEGEMVQILRIVKEQPSAPVRR